MNSLRGTIEITGDLVQLQTYVNTNKQLENKNDDTGHLIFKQNNVLLQEQINELNKKGLVSDQTIKTTIFSENLEVPLDYTMPVFFENFFAQLSFQLLNPNNKIDKRSVANYVEPLFREGFSIKTMIKADYNDNIAYTEHVVEERMDTMYIEKLSNVDIYTVLFESGPYKDTHYFRPHFRTNIDSKTQTIEV